MWSLTSQRVRRTSGPENFQSSTKKDFFNTIRQERKSRFIVDIETPVRRYCETHRKAG